MEPRLIRTLLLDLLGTTSCPDEGRLGAMKAEDWAQLQTMAALHRLGPLLHSRHKSNEAIPPDVRQAWQDAYRAAAMTSMAIGAELNECARLLETGGFAPVALKGAYLAKHSYPEPAQRPLRDIDFLLPQESILDAYRFLLAAGYSSTVDEARSLDDIIRFAKHLPTVIAPRGTPIELHHRLSRPDDSLGHRSPEGLETAVLANVRSSDGLRFPSPQDQMAHLIIHACYDHRLDCGPLVISDIYYLQRSDPIDWTALWSRAGEGGWTSGARLIVELVRIHYGQDAIPQCPNEPERPPPDILDLAAELLLQSLDARTGAKFAASLGKAGPLAMLWRFFGQTDRSGGTVIERSLAEKFRLLGRAIVRLGQAARELSSASTRQQSRQLADFSDWLDNQRP